MELPPVLRKLLVVLLNVLLWQAQLAVSIRNNNVAEINSELSAEGIRDLINSHYDQGQGLELRLTLSPLGNPFDFKQLSAILTNHKAICPACPGLIISGTVEEPGPHTPTFNCSGQTTGDVLESDESIASISHVTFSGCSLSIGSLGYVHLREVVFSGGILSIQDYASLTLQGLRLINAPLIITSAHNTTLSNTTLVNAPLIITSAHNTALSNTTLVNTTLMIKVNNDTEAVDIENVCLLDSSVEIDGDAPDLQLRLVNITMKETWVLPNAAPAAINLQSSFLFLTMENSTFDRNRVPAVFLQPRQNTRFTSRATFKRCQFSNIHIHNNNHSNLSAGLSIDIAKIHLVLDSCKFDGNQLVQSSPTDALIGAALRVLFKGSGSSVVLNRCNLTANTLLLSRNKSIEGVELPSLHGAACAFSFGDFAKGNSLHLLDCNISSNSAFQGGGIVVQFRGASKNQVSITGSSPASDSSGLCEFSGNNATEFAGNKSKIHTGKDFQGKGGGLLVLFNPINVSSQENNVNIYQCLFRQNSAAAGGAIFVDSTKNKLKNSLNVSACFFYGNSAISGAALAMWSIFSSSWEKEALLAARLANLSFTRNMAYFRGTLEATAVQIHTSGQLTFFDNTNTAVYLRQAFVYANGSMKFEQNFGHVGAGIFSSTSQIVAYTGSSFHFTKNAVTWVGGGVYAQMDDSSIEPVATNYNPFCFIDRLSENSSQQSVSVTFYCNAAGQAGPAIYLPDSLPCISKGSDIRKWFTFTHNVLLPELKQRSFNANPPGGSANIHAQKPGEDAWNRHFLPSQTSTPLAKMCDKAKLDQSIPALGSDVSILRFYDKANPQYGNMSCQKARRMKKGPGNVTVLRVSPGSDKLQLSVIACNDLDHESDALLSFTVHPHKWFYNVPKAANLSDCSLPTITSGQLSYLKATSQLTEPITLASCRRSSSANATIYATPAGTARQVSDMVHVQLQPCKPGYIEEPMPSTEEGDELFTCHCRTTGESAKPDPHIRKCNGSQITVKPGYWITNGTEGTLIAIVCPPGYCRGQASEDGWIYNSKNRDAQCRGDRHKLLCGRCPRDSFLTMDIFSGSCVSECWLSYSSSIGVTIVFTFVLSLLVLWIDLPLSSDIRPLLFFGSTIRMIFFRNDYAIRSSEAGTLNYQHALSIMLSVAGFSFEIDHCHFPVHSAVDILFLSYLAPLCIVISIIVWHFMYYCCNQKSSNFHGTLFLLYYVYSHCLDISYLLLSYVDIQTELHERRFFYDATVAFFSSYEFYIAAFLAGFLTGGTLLRFLYVLVKPTRCWTCLAAAFRWPCRSKLDNAASSEHSDEGSHLLSDSHKYKEQARCRCSPRMLIPPTGYVSGVISNMEDALKAGLANNARPLWSWDLLRRAIIYLLFFSYAFTSNSYPSWFVHDLITLSLAAFLAIHVYAQPYINTDNKKKEPKQVIIESMFLLLPVCLPEKNWARVCNFWEAIVLVLMTIIALLSRDTFGIDASHPGARVWVAYFIIFSLLGIYFIFVLFKVFYLLTNKCRALCGCCDCLHKHRQHKNLRESELRLEVQIDQPDRGHLQTTDEDRF